MRAKSGILIAMSGQLIFADDSGDPGIKKGSSQYFAIACVVFDDEAEAALAAETMNEYKAQLGWSREAEFKFNKTQKKYVLDLFRRLEGVRFKVVATLINKSVLGKSVKPGTLYNETIRDTLLLCAPQGAKVRLDGHAGRNYMKSAVAYFRKSVNIDDIDNRKIIDFRFVDSAQNVLVQLADLVAGSVLRSTNKSKTDSKDYLNALEGREKLIRIVDSENSP